MILKCSPVYSTCNVALTRMLTPDKGSIYGNVHSGTHGKNKK